MSLTTVEVELDHGRVTPRGNESLPEHANALLTILPAKTTSRDPLIQHPELGKAIFYENPALPLHTDHWPDEALKIGNAAGQGPGAPPLQRGLCLLGIGLLGEASQPLQALPGTGRLQPRSEQLTATLGLAWGQVFGAFATIY